MAEMSFAREHHCKPKLVRSLDHCLVLDAPSYRHLAYNVGMNQVMTVVKGGSIVRGSPGTC